MKRIFTFHVDGKKVLELERMPSTDDMTKIREDYKASFSSYIKKDYTSWFSSVCEQQYHFSTKFYKKEDNKE